MSIVFSSCFWSSVVGCGVVYWAFLLVISWWTSAMGIEWGSNLRTLLSVVNGHVYILLFLMDFRSVLVVGLPIDRCRKVRVSFVVTSGVTALVCGYPFGMDGWGLDSFGNLHRLVSGYLYPVRIVCPPFDTYTCCFVNINSHPLSHSIGIEARGSCIFLNLYAFLNST